MLPLLLLAFPTATAAPTWKWEPGKPARFHVESTVFEPRGRYVFSSINLDARVYQVALVLDLECTPAPLGKSVELTCALAYAKISATGSSASQATVDAIMAEWSERLRPATIVLVIGPTGALRDLDIQGVEKKNDKDGAIVDANHMFVKRAVALFDFPLSTDDKDWIRGWQQKGEVHAFDLPTATGTLGSVEYKHTPVGERYGYTVIESGGRGTITYGGAVDASTGSLFIDTRIGGEALIDPALGRLVYRGLSMDGRLTAASAGVGNDALIGVQQALQRVDAFLPDGAAPPSIGSLHAAKRALSPPPPGEGVDLLPFDSLGMKPLFIQGCPPRGLNSTCRRAL